MSFKKNILANYIGSIGIALAPIIALPWYLKLLGTEQYGLVSFVVMLQAILGLVDAGASQALVREMTLSLNSEGQSTKKLSNLLFGFERVYWLFAIVVAISILVSSDLISTKWLTLIDLPKAYGNFAVYGAAIIFLFQFPGSIYRSLLIAKQEHITLNFIMFTFSSAKHLGAVILVIIWPSIITYLLWHIFIIFAETLVRAHYAWKSLGTTRDCHTWNSKNISYTTKIVIGMSGATLLGALTVQMDKIVLSSMVNIEQFAYYSIASTVATGALQLIYPLTQAALPKAICLHNNKVALRNFSKKLFISVTLLTLLGFLLFSLIGKSALLFWLGDSKAVDVVYPILSVLLIGTAMNAIYNIGYINWLANERVNKIFQVNLIALIFSVIFIPILINIFGVIGASFGWLFINLIGLVISFEWLRKV